MRRPIRRPASGDLTCLPGPGQRLEEPARLPQAGEEGMVEVAFEHRKTPKLRFTQCDE